MSISLDSTIRTRRTARACRRHGREAGRISWPLVAIIAIVAALAGAEFYALVEHGRPHRSVETPAAEPAAPEKAVGWIDSPAEDTIAGPALRITGWALDRAGVAAVQVRVDERTYPATIGIARPDVAQAKPGYPDSATAGFAFAGDVAPHLAANPGATHTARIVVIARDGRETVLGERHVVAGASAAPFADLFAPDSPPAARKFAALMMTSGVATGGADEIDTVYRPYLSRTTEVGFAVPILYLRTTAGARGDWTFDPDFDLSRKCKDRAVAEDTLSGVIAVAIARGLPVQFILNGGIWADATCDTPEWDVNDHLEQDIANCQWTQRNEVLPDDHAKNLPGSTRSPELGRSLTYNVYATAVRHYKRRNLQAAATIIARFAREHPTLFAGVVLDADTYMNPFVRDGRWYDYNPGMLKQFRHWLAGSGPYAGAGGPGIPDLRSYRRRHRSSLADVNRIARAHWTSWDDVDPPRAFPGEGGGAVPEGTPRFWEDPWFREWDSFRKHVVGLHYDELATWVHAAGIPRDRIFSAQAFIAPDAGMRPVSIHIMGASPDYDSAGVSIEGAIPRDGHLGAILYGPAAENRHPLEDGRSLFATLARMDPGWGIVEYNATDLKHPTVLPAYASTYRTLRDLFNFDGRQIAMMAWNGSNGVFAGQPGYVPYTSWRNTPGEDALRDFLASHADLPQGSRLWTFGSPRHADDDGWSLARGALRAGRGYIEIPAGEAFDLVSPADQVVRAATADRLLIGFAAPERVTRLQVFAREADGRPWIALTPAMAAADMRRVRAGLEVPLAWPRDWRARGGLAERLRITGTLAPGADPVRVQRIAVIRSPG